MGSNYFGEQNYLGNSERGAAGLSSSSLSSRKGKKGSSDKPKQPQRGLGVAQLEKIRLHSQLGCSYLPPVHNPYASSFSQEDIRLQTAYSSASSSFSYSSSSSAPSYGFQGHHGVMMGLQELDRANITYADSQSSSVARFQHNSTSFLPNNADVSDKFLCLNQMASGQRRLWGSTICGAKHD
ncbi:UNVERIFIED_CONTAM: protein SPEAR1 [Sesamum latifolium]|uniref:Protein SPEAR1 n=1 Tax=Sesamum latifolium TaxID=2727402 RepID=A0AAW2U047_9LAMI